MGPLETPEERIRALGGMLETTPAKSDQQQIWLKVGSDVEIARLVTADLRKEFGELVCCEGAVWHYNGTHWIAVAEEALWLAAERYDGALFDTPEGKTQAVKLSKSRVQSILACIRPAVTRRNFFDTAPTGINCSTGFIRFDGHGRPLLEPHSPDHRCRHVLPGRWPILSDAERYLDPLFTRLLDGCFKEDDDKQQKIDLLGEVAGIAALGFATKMVNPKALVLKGEKAENGKSQVLDVLRSLLPSSAVSSISPSKFHDRTFACHLADKLLNAPDELAGSDAIASEIFKQIITGEPLTTRDVYKSAAAFRPIAQHVFATNNLPTFRSGMDRGVRRRLIVLVFNRVIPKEERIERIGQRIGIEEADLLLDWAVDGASRVLKNREFTEPASSAEALRDWILSSDPVLAWLDSDEVEFGVNAYVPQVRTKLAYANFRLWATEEGYSSDRLPAVNGFSQRVIAGAAERGVRKARTCEGPMFVGLASVRGRVHGV